MKDLILFAIDKTQSDIKERIVPIAFLNLKNIPEQETGPIQAAIKELADALAPYGYHMWTSREYVGDKKTE